MRTLFLLMLLSIFTFSCKQEAKTESNEANHENHEMATDKEATTPKKVLSPHTETMAMIGDAHIHIDYSSPGVRDRIIFGGLVGYDQVWQAGAHRATWIETNKDLIIDGKTLPAGKYGLFTIPSKDEWTIMLNSNWDQHGKDDYDETDDVLRFTVKPMISEDITEHLVYKVNKVSEEAGTISLAWEKVTVSFPFKIK